MLANKKVIIADDEPRVLGLLEALLSSLGPSKIDKVRNGRDLFDKVKEAYEKNDSYHLIITDHNMPSMEGLTAVNLIRDFDKETYIILHTSEDINNSKRKELNIAYLKKPASIIEFYSLIRRMGK